MPCALYYYAANELSAFSGSRCFVEDNRTHSASCPLSAQRRTDRFALCPLFLGRNISHIKLTDLPCVLCFGGGNISHIIQLTPQELSAEPRNSTSAEALAVARRPTEASLGMKTTCGLLATASAAGNVSRLCALRLWRELYDLRDEKNKKNRRRILIYIFFSCRCQRGDFTRYASHRCPLNA